LVRISFLAAMAKIDMVEDKITPRKKNLSLRLIFPLRQFCTNYFFASCTTTSTKVIVNGISIDMALTACSLQTTVPASTIYSRVKARREKGTYNALILRRVEEARQVGLIIDITQDDDDSSMNVSPVTMNTNEGSCFCSTATSLQLSGSQLTRKTSRRSPKQASIA
jgi:hypothetical protein